MLENIRFHVPKSGKSISLLLIRIKKDGGVKVLEKGGDITKELASALALKLSIDAKKRDDNRGYAGFNVPKVGKLVLFLPDYDFKVIRPFDVDR